MYTLTNNQEINALLRQISLLEDLALAEEFRYPGGGIGFLKDADMLRERVKELLEDGPTVDNRGHCGIMVK